MIRTLIRLARRAVGFIGIVLLLALIAFSLVTNLAPLTGREVFVIIGGSMEPAIPIGSLVVATRTDPQTIVVGDVVTVRADNGIVVTHRVNRIVDLPEGRFFELKGDANETPDGGLVPARAIIGAADLYVPYAGYARRFMSTPIGMVATLSALGAIFLTYLLLTLLGPQASTVHAPVREPVGR